jgi:tetratricopeptide (TPR) repeat protein
MFELKPLSREAIPAALEKAHRYRLLNEPLEAESICRDILEIDPENQAAMVILLLALTDQFEERPNPCLEQAREVLSRIRDEYSRTYHAGIVCERRAKTQLKRGGSHAGHIAYDWFKEAMEHYEEAAAIRPPGNDDAILRWNTCARILMAHRELIPAPEETSRQWLE